MFDGMPITRNDIDGRSMNWLDNECEAYNIIGLPINTIDNKGMPINGIEIMRFHE